MIKYYQQYIDIVTKKGPEEMAKATVIKLIRAYNTMAAGYANTDKMKQLNCLIKRLLLILRMDMQSNQLRCLKTRNNNIITCKKTDS
jgi:hypothetical protein